MRAVLAALLLASCAAPSIDDCTVGSSWAECPGSGGPTLACERSDHAPCYWISGSIPDGYAPCDTPTGGCCFGMHATVWDRTRERNVSVVLAPVSAETRPAIACGDADPLRLWAPWSLVFSASAYRSHGTVTGALRTEQAVSGSDLGVDVVREADGTLSGRICRVPWTDLESTYCPATRTESCATSGTITMAAWPDTDGPVALDAHFVLDGVTIDLRM